MSGSRQRDWLTDILEGLPTIIFVALWRSDVDQEFAGWIGAGLAATVIAGFRLSGVRFNSILLGMNLHLMVVIPAIEALFVFGTPDLARTLIATGETGVLVFVFIVGCILTAFSPRGFIGIDGLPPAARRTYSMILLAVSAATIPWSFLNLGHTLLSIGIPVMALFGLRRLLIARWQDRAHRVDGGGSEDGILAALAVPTGDPG